MTGQATLTAALEGDQMEVALVAFLRSVAAPVTGVQLLARRASGRQARTAGYSPQPQDASWFYDFYTSTAPRLRAYLGQLVRNPDLADDLAQESYLRLLRIELPTHEPTRLRSYLYKTATNLARDNWRRTTRRREESLEGNETPALAREGLGLDLDRVLKELPEQQRSLLWLAYVEGASHREIAAVLDLQEGSVRVLLFRARRKMAQLMRSRGLVPGDKDE